MATIEFTTITPRSGGLIHATTIHDPSYTACGLQWRGWVIAPYELTCKACQEAIEGHASGTKGGKGKRKK